MSKHMATAIEALESRHFKRSRLNANHYILSDRKHVVDACLSPSMGFSLSGPLESLPTILSSSVRQPGMVMVPVSTAKRAVEAIRSLANDYRVAAVKWRKKKEPNTAEICDRDAKTLDEHEAILASTLSGAPQPQVVTPEQVEAALLSTFEEGGYDSGIGEIRHVIEGAKVRLFVAEVIRNLKHLSPKEEGVQR